LRLMTGFCFAVLYVVIESWLNEQSDNENRASVFSAYVFISMTVMAVGQQMTVLYDPSNMALFALASVLVSLAALPVVMSTSPAPCHNEAVRFDFRRLLEISHTGMVVCFATGLTNGAFWALAPVFTSGISDKVSLAAGFMTGAVIGGAAGQLPSGFWSDRVDRRIVISVLALLAAAVGVGLWLTYGKLSTAQLIVLSGIWGALAFPMNSVAVAHTNDFAQEGEYVMVSGGLLLMYGIGAVIGPALAAGAMTLMGDSVLYLYTAITHLLVCVFVIVRQQRRASASKDQHVPFTEALTAVQTASRVYEEEQER